MPKSKRNKIVSLVNTKKKSFNHKKELVEQIRRCTDDYKHAFTFSVENMRNSKLKKVRNEWKDSRFFFGKNNIAQIAFGRSLEDEYKDGLHRISKKLHGNVGLLFTNREKDAVIRWFEIYTEKDYARAGFLATYDVELPEGPLDQFPHAIEPHLRQLGLPTSLRKGIVTLNTDYIVCKTGDKLTPEQARILKLIAEPMATFQIKLLSVWTADGTYEDL